MVEHTREVGCPEFLKRMSQTWDREPYPQANELCGENVKDNVHSQIPSIVIWVWQSIEFINVIIEN